MTAPRDRLTISPSTARRLADRLDPRWRPPEIPCARFRALLAGRARELSIEEIRLLACWYPEVPRCLGLPVAPGRGDCP